MNRNLVALLSISVLAAACGVAPKPSARTAAAAKAKPEKSIDQATAPDDALEAEAVAPTDSRRVGDYVVSRITGSFSKQPMMLTEKVLARGHGRITIEYTLLEGRTASCLRVERDMKSEHVVHVTRIDGQTESLGDVNDYDAMMRKIAFAADDNQGATGSETQTCTIGAKEIPCERTIYKVKVGDKVGTLSVAHSDAVPDRDLSGEVRTDDGNVVYHAEIIEVGNEAPANSVAVAE